MSCWRMPGRLAAAVAIAVAGVAVLPQAVDRAGAAENLGWRDDCDPQSAAGRRR